MIATVPTVENLTLNLALETHVRASLAATFDALLEQIGPHNETHEGKPLAMKLEPRPGGRWYRDLGEDNGHFWGYVQAIKRPTLLEISGPLFMSFPAISNLQYRLTEVDGGTLITFRHTALGFIPDDYMDKMPQGWKEGVAQTWEHLLSRVRRQAEGRR